MSIAAILTAVLGLATQAAPVAPVALACHARLTQTDGHGVSRHLSYPISFVIHWADTWMTTKAPWGSSTLTQRGPSVLHFVDAPDGYTIFSSMPGPGQYLHQSVTRFSHDWRHAVYGGNDHLRGYEIKRETGTLDCTREKG